MDGNQTQSLLTVGEAARLLRLSTFTVYRRIEAGDLQAVRVGENGPLRIHRTALHGFLIAAAPKDTAYRPAGFPRSRAGDRSNHMSVRTDLREGREAGVPLCCRLRFAIEYALVRDHEQAVRRGIRFNHDGIEYVPCRVLHRATVTHAEHEQTLARR